MRTVWVIKYEPPWQDSENRPYYTAGEWSVNARGADHFAIKYLAYQCLAGFSWESKYLKVKRVTFRKAASKRRVTITRGN